MMSFQLNFSANNTPGGDNDVQMYGMCRFCGVIDCNTPPSTGLSGTQFVLASMIPKDQKNITTLK
jgi:hypothetical protein